MWDRVPFRMERRRNVNTTVHGFSLVEMVATIVILAIALVSVSFMVSRGLTESADTYDQTRTTALAQAYLEEILGRRFDEETHPSGSPPCFGLPSDSPTPDRPCTPEADFGPDGDENERQEFDDVDDFHGLDEGDGTGGPLLDAEGNPRQGYDNFRVQVSLTYAGDQPPVNKSHPTHAKLITVTVIHTLQPDGVEFGAFKGNY